MKYIIIGLLLLSFNIKAQEVSDKDRIDTLNDKIESLVDEEKYKDAQQLIHIVRHLRSSQDGSFLLLEPTCERTEIPEEEKEFQSAIGKDYKETYAMEFPRNWKDYRVLIFLDNSYFTTLPLSIPLNDLTAYQFDSNYRISLLTDSSRNLVNHPFVLHSIRYVEDGDEECPSYRDFGINRFRGLYFLE